MCLQSLIMKNLILTLNILKIWNKQQKAINKTLIIKSDKWIKDTDKSGIGF